MYAADLDTEAVTLITGGAQGIGAAIARRFAAAGAKLAINDLTSNDALETIVQETAALAAPADISNRNHVHNMFKSIVAHAGPVGTVICNAAYMTMAPFLEHETDDWWKVVDTNLTGAFNVIQEALPSLRQLGGGRIVIVSSIWGVIGWPDATAYSASKAGLVSLVKTLGRELAPEGIIVNGIAPGVTSTPQLHVDAMSAGLSLAEMEQQYATSIPLGRVARPEEIAAGVAFLADRRLQQMVGTILQVNGGEVRGRV